MQEEGFCFISNLSYRSGPASHHRAISERCLGFLCTRNDECLNRGGGARFKKPFQTISFGINVSGVCYRQSLSFYCSIDRTKNGTNWFSLCLINIVVRW